MNKATTICLRPLARVTVSYFGAASHHREGIRGLDAFTIPVMAGSGSWDNNTSAARSTPRSASS